VRASVLVVDDERVFRVMAEEALGAEGYEVRSVANLARARAELARATPDVIILDRRLPDGDGIVLLESLRAEAATGPLVIVVTAYGDLENAVAALRAGAADYLTKPLQVADLLVKLQKALESRGLRERLVLARSSKGRPPLTAGKSAAERALRERLKSVSASASTPVLLVGPSGAGKQCAAELLHEMTYARGQDAECDAPFVEVNCAALPAELVESELFGHEKGAFTDARAMRRGLVEMAGGGTLFLDEVTELPERSQAKLLKFLDTMRFRRVGGEREIDVQLRVVAATNRNIAELASSGGFREDFYHRLSVFTVEVPPLSARREDIADLVDDFVAFYAPRVNKRITGVTPGARKRLATYDYPGNVRELRNIIERAVILARGPELTEEDVVLAPAGSAPPAAGGFFAIGLGPDGAPPSADQVQQAYVRRVLEHFGGRRMQAAQALGMAYPTFLRRLRELGFE
jgi:two-component system response regulator AtoC